MKAIRLLVLILGLAQLTVGFGQIADAQERRRSADNEQGKRTRVLYNNDSNRPWLGVEIVTVSDEFAREHDLTLTSGVYIENVTENSPAEEAGLRAGDVILEYDRTKVTSADQLIDLVADGEAGDEVTILLSRDGSKRKEIVTLGTWEDSTPNRFRLRDLDSHGDFSWTEFAGNSYLGVTLETVDGQLAEYFGVSDGSAALVTEVTEDSPAEKAGLKAGDVIIAIDGEPTETLGDVQKSIRAKESGEEVSITALRDRRKSEFTATVAENENSRNEFYNKLGRLKEYRFDDEKGLRGDFEIQTRHKPRMRGLLRGDSGPNTLFLDLEDRNDEMKALKKRMKKLERELAELKEKLSDK